MFDIGAAELLLIVIVAIIVIGPSEMPRALRTAGQWIGKIRRVSGHFRAGIDAMVREAEIEEMEKQWKEKNAKIMAEHPHDMLPADPSSAESRGEVPDAVPSEDPYPPEPAVAPAHETAPKVIEGDPDELADAARKRARPTKKADSKPVLPPTSSDEPPLPFGSKDEG